MHGSLNVKRHNRHLFVIQTLTLTAHRPILYCTLEKTFLNIIIFCVLAVLLHINEINSD